MGGSYLSNHKCRRWGKEQGCDLDAVPDALHDCQFIEYFRLGPNDPLPEEDDEEEEATLGKIRHITLFFSLTE